MKKEIKANILATKTDEKLDNLRTWLLQFFPENTLVEIMKMIRKHKIHLKITNPRRSVLGTYKAPINRNFHAISINSDLNKYQFLKTFLHEYAHLLVHVNYDYAKSHGIEWKNTFRQILHYFIKKDLFPDDVRLALQEDMIKMYAKSSLKLHKILKSYGNCDYNSGKIDYCCCCTYRGG